jgi:hypothetical protein
MRQSLLRRLGIGVVCASGILAIVLPLCGVWEIEWRWTQPAEMPLPYHYRSHGGFIHDSYINFSVPIHIPLAVAGALGVFAAFVGSASRSRTSGNSSDGARTGP